jgi:hypothetical protein
VDNAVKNRPAERWRALAAEALGLAQELTDPALVSSMRPSCFARRLAGKISKLTNLTRAHGLIDEGASPD